MDFVFRIRQIDPHCDSSVSKKTKSNNNCGFQCHKISYSFTCAGKAILIAHHFHQVESGYKELVRVMTYGVIETKIKKVLCKSLRYLKLPLQQASEHCPKGRTVLTSSLTPHPKAILCSMLESLEENCRDEIAYDRKIIIKNEEDIRNRSDTLAQRSKGLQSNYVKLSNARIRLGDQREKLQYLESSVASLEQTNGLPEENTGELDTTAQTQLAQIYGDQLNEVKSRLKTLKVKCRQLNIYIENLKDRVEGILCIVSPSPIFISIHQTYSPSI